MSRARLLLLLGNLALLAGFLAKYKPSHTFSDGD
jgi:hypothetical protein